MNRVFKTVWSTARRALVVVSEAHQSHTKAAKSAGASTDARPTFKGSLVATAVLSALAFSQASLAAIDPTYNNNFDSSGGVTHHNNVTVNTGVTLTHNEKYVEDGEEFGGENTLYTVDQTLTNKGTIYGDGAWKVGNLVNETGANLTTGLVTFTGASDASTEVLNNAGTAVLEAVAGKGKFTNTGSLTIQSDWTMNGNALANNAGTVTLKNVTIADGTITGASGTTTKAQSITLQKGSITSEGTVEVANGLTTASATTVDVTTLKSTGAIANAGTLTVDGLQFQGASDTFLNTGSATLGTVTGEGTFTNQADADMTFTEDYTVASGKVFTNAGELTAQKTMTVAGELANSASTGVTINALNVTGSVTGAGSMGVTGNATIAQGATFTQQNLTSDSLVSAGTMTVAGKVTANSADFNEGAAGTINETVVPTITHNGTMTITTASGVQSLTNEGGELNITTLNGVEGGADIVNQTGAQATIATVTNGKTATNVGTLNIATGTFSGKVDNQTGGTLGSTAKITAGEFANAGTANLVALDATTIKNTDGTFTATGLVTGTTAENSAQMNLADATVTTVKNLTDGTMLATGKVDTDDFQNASQATIATLEADAFSNTAGKVTSGTAITIGTGTNDAEVAANNFTVTTGFTNNKTLAATGTSDVTGFKQSADGAANFADVTFKGTSEDDGLNGAVTSTGTITVASGAVYDGAATVDANVLSVLGDLTAKTVEATGATTVTGNLAVSESATLADTTVNAAGSLTTAGNSSIASLSMEEGASLTHGSALDDVLTITTGAKLDGVVYNQKNGTIAFSDGKWFTNSTLNISGGSLDMTTMANNTLGTGNTYTISGSGTGAVGDEMIDSDWKDGRTVVTVGTLDSNNLVTLSAGGVLDVNKITLTTNSWDNNDSLVFNGGALQTSLDQFFDGIGTDALLMEAMDEEDRVVITGSTIGITTVGDFKESTNFMQFTSGDIVFDDALISVETVADIKEKFSTLTSADSGSINLHFTGTTNKVFTVDVANDLLTNGSGAEVGVIFDNTTLYSRTDAEETGKTLVVGGVAEAGEVALNGNMGFSNVALTESVSIENGEFALVGKADQNFSALVGTNGSVTVSGADSQFTIGTMGRTDMTGSLNTLTLADSGKGLVKNGHYKIATLDAQNGTFETWAGANTEVATMNLAATGIVDNKGTMSIAAFSDVAGAQTGNAGVMTFTTATTVKGNVTNKTSGTMTYNEKLTVEGLLTTEASSTTNVGDMDVTSEVGVVNAGTLVATGTVNVTGGSTSDPATSGKYTLLNKEGGVLNFADATTVVGSATTTYVDGDAARPVLKNEGTAQFGDLTAHAGAVLRNYGETAQMMGDTLTLDAESSLANTGTVSFTTIVANGTIRNKGTIGSDTVNMSSLANTEDGARMIVNKELTIADGGELTNSEGAMLYAANALSTIGEDAKASNKGVAYFGTLRTMAGASYLNEGETVVEDLEVGADSTVTNEETLSFGSAKIEGTYTNNGEVAVGESMTILGEGAYTNNGSTAVVKDVIMQGNGTLTQADGSFTALTLDLQSGTVNVTGGEATFGATKLAGGVLSFAGAGEEAITGSVMLDGEFNGALAIDNAHVTLGVANGVDTQYGMPEPVYAASTLIADVAPIEIGATGKLAVGTGAKDKVATMGDGDAWFGDGSMFVIDTGKMTTIEEGGVTALLGNGTGKLTIEEGAQLHVANVGWGNYYVTKDFADESMAEGSWDVLNSYSPEGDKALTVTQDEDGNVILTVGSADIRDLFPDVAVPETVNEVIGDPNLRDPNKDNVIGFISKAVEETWLDINDQSEVINTVAQIGAAGGMYAQNMTLVQNVMDMTERHLGFEDVHFLGTASMPWDGVRLWANALGQKTDASGYDFSGGSASYDGTNAGVILGVDFITDNEWRWGAAFAAQKGNIDSTGSVVKTSNEADAYSAYAYLAKRFGMFNVMGTLGYTRISSELEQTLPGSMQMGAHKMDADSDIITASVKAEMQIPVGDKGAVVPYIGARALTMLSADSTSKMGGQDAFKYDQDTATQFQFPIGVALQAHDKTDSGWVARGLFDVSVTPVAGDKEADIKVNAAGLNAVDKTSATFADDVFGTVRMGLSAEKDNVMFGGQLGVTTGASRDADVTFGVNLRVKF